ncbi:TA system VapC family ribonuclease toxin [Telmatobacter bradus]|uniref:TA system VapC family ribonuclease toxin n=1 Tax=Telmatobacter bradus TaxID=474953 RepID=UPI003B42E0BA
MRYLLDVNALIALGLHQHQAHPRVTRWIDAQQNLSFLTCSITELGFVRIISNPSVYGFTVDQARTQLLDLKSTPGLFTFLEDAHDITHLPAWVQFSAQTTDGHLLALAESHDAQLATLDARLPGAFLIP